MICLYFLKDFYKVAEILKEGSYGIKGHFRVLFFVLIPLIFVAQVKSYLFEFMEPAMWVSVLIAYGFHKRLKYGAILYEMYILALFAFIVSFGNVDILGPDGWNGASLLAIFFIESGHKIELIKKSDYKPLLNATPYLVFSAISLLYFKVVNDNIGESLSVFSLLLFSSVYSKDKFTMMMDHLSLGTNLACIVNLIAIVSLFMDDSIVALILILTNFVLFGLILQNSKSWYDLEKEQRRWDATAIFFHVQIALVYLGSAEKVCSAVDTNGQSEVV